VSRLFQIALEQSPTQYNLPAAYVTFMPSTLASVTMLPSDFDRKPTKVFYTVQRQFAPVCASPWNMTGDTRKSGEPFRCGIWAINDKWESVPAPLPISTGAFWMPGALGRPPANGLYQCRTTLCSRLVRPNGLRRKGTASTSRGGT